MGRGTISFRLCSMCGAVFLKDWAADWSDVCACGGDIVGTPEAQKRYHSLTGSYNAYRTPAPAEKKKQVT